MTLPDFLQWLGGRLKIRAKKEEPYKRLLKRMEDAETIVQAAAGEISTGDVTELLDVLGAMKIIFGQMHDQFDRDKKVFLDKNAEAASQMEGIIYQLLAETQQCVTSAQEIKGAIRSGTVPSQLVKEFSQVNGALKRMREALQKLEVLASVFGPWKPGPTPSRATAATKAPSYLERTYGFGGKNMESESFFRDKQKYAAQGAAIERFKERILRATDYSLNLHKLERKGMLAGSLHARLTDNLRIIYHLEKPKERDKGSVLVWDRIITKNEYMKI